MDFLQLQTVTAGAVAAFDRRVPLTPLSVGAYASMRYPKFPPVMRFGVRRYAAKGFGNLFTMDTRALFGKMQLATLVFTPNLGGNVPLLLIDCMAMGKKRAAFIEYYDLTARGAACPELEANCKRYGSLANYAEKPAWYVAERAPYSLIKGGADVDDAALCEMLEASVEAYATICAAQTARTAENREKLSAFIDRMVTKGNPSSAVLERVLGKAGAEAFFRTRVMPADFTSGAADAPES